MTTIISSLTLLLLLLAFSTHIFGFPANWLIIAILALWDWLAPNSSMLSGQDQDKLILD